MTVSGKTYTTVQGMSPRLGKRAGLFVPTLVAIPPKGPEELKLFAAVPGGNNMKRLIQHDVSTHGYSVFIRFIPSSADRPDLNSLSAH